MTLKSLIFILAYSFGFLSGPAGTNNCKPKVTELLGKSLSCITTKAQMDVLFAEAMKDPEQAAKIAEIVPKIKLSGTVCYGILDDGSGNNWCLKPSDFKGSLCAYSGHKVTSFTFITRYYVIYDCLTLDLYYFHPIY